MSVVVASSDQGSVNSGEEVYSGYKSFLGILRAMHSFARKFLAKERKKGHNLCQDSRVENYVKLWLCKWYHYNTNEMIRVYATKSRFYISTNFKRNGAEIN